MPVTRGEKGELHLALEGQEEHGIRISQSTTLAYVREHFPVPPAYVFGVPTRLEKAYLATDFLPLMLLKSEDTLSGKLGGGAPPVDYKLERDRLMSEVAQLREKLAAARDAHADAQRAAATHTDRLETELAAARTRAQEADVAMQEARNLRERTTELEGEVEEAKRAVQRETNRLIAQLADERRAKGDAAGLLSACERERDEFRERARASQLELRRERLRVQGLRAAAEGLARGLAALRAQHAAVRADAERALGEASRDARATAAGAVRALEAGSGLSEAADAAAQRAEGRAAAAREEAAAARAESQRVRSDLDDARAELKRLRADRGRLAADAKRRESGATAEAARLAAELAAREAEVAEKAREAKRARGEAEAARSSGTDRERKLGAELTDALAERTALAERAAELESALAQLGAELGAARAAQEEAETAWAQLGGRRPITFVEYIELRRQVQMLAAAGREFFATPNTHRAQQTFLEAVARVETMLTGARDPAAARAAAASGNLPIARSTGIGARAASFSAVPDAVLPPSHAHVGVPKDVMAAAAAAMAANSTAVGRRPSAGGGAAADRRRWSASSGHVHQLQELRAKRQPSGRVGY